MKTSIIIPAYNAEAYIERALESALSQDFPKKDYEVLVIDDGSTDRTPEILKSFGDKIRVIRQENRGFAGATNRGYKEALGELVVKLDSDDVFSPNLLSEEAPLFERDEALDFVYSDYWEEEGGERKLVNTENIFNSVAIGTMYRKSRLAQAGWWREDAKFPECELLLRTWGKWKGLRIPKPLFTYIRRPGSASKNTNYHEDALSQLRALHPDKHELIRLIRSY